MLINLKMADLDRFWRTYLVSIQICQTREWPSGELGIYLSNFTTVSGLCLTII